MDISPYWNDIFSSKNPFIGALCLGVINAALTSIGAAIRHQDVFNETMVILVGGSITGFCGNLLILMLSCIFENFFVNVVIFLIGLLISSEIGRMILQVPDSWADTLLSNLIGLVIGLGIGCSLWLGMKAYRYHQTRTPLQYAIYPNHAVVPEDLAIQDLEIRQACFTG